MYHVVAPYLYIQVTLQMTLNPTWSSMFGNGALGAFASPKTRRRFRILVQVVGVQNTLLKDCCTQFYDFIRLRFARTCSDTPIESASACISSRNVSTPTAMQKSFFWLTVLFYFSCCERLTISPSICGEQCPLRLSQPTQVVDLCSVQEQISVDVPAKKNWIEQSWNKSSTKITAPIHTGIKDLGSKG